MVTKIVTIKEVLLKRIKTSGYPDFSTGPTTKAKVEEDFPTKNEPG